MMVWCCFTLLSLSFFLFSKSARIYILIECHYPMRWLNKWNNCDIDGCPMSNSTVYIIITYKNRSFVTFMFVTINLVINYHVSLQSTPLQNGKSISLAHTKFENFFSSNAKPVAEWTAKHICIFDKIRSINKHANDTRYRI